MDRSAAIIGGGPAGLMAAEIISAHGVKVEVFDSMPSVGRKFLMAGKSGLNITHSDPFDLFVSKFGMHRGKIEPLLKNFGPNELLDWVHSLGIETFIGTSGRVFPAGMKASPLLRAWLSRLNASGVTLNLRHKWTGFLPDNSLRFLKPGGELTIKPDAVVLALGGGSWSRLGSDGGWVPWLKQAGAEVKPLVPSNCGFDVQWSEHFCEKYEGYPVKSVILSFGRFRQKGEFIITKEGVEGSLVYAASAMLRDEISANGKAIMLLDLKPERTLAWLKENLSRPRGKRSLSSHLDRTLGIKGVKAGLLREFVSRDDFEDTERLAGLIKALPVPLVAPRPLDESISSAGGVTFESLNENLMLRTMPGVFCAGEMLDWEAPTGGYLLTACFSSGYAAGHGAIRWLGIP